MNQNHAKRSLTPQKCVSRNGNEAWNDETFLESSDQSFALSDLQSFIGRIAQSMRHVNEWLDVFSEQEIMNSKSKEALF